MSIGKVLVTGADGFIGKNLCRRLSTLGFDVLGWDSGHGVDQRGFEDLLGLVEGLTLSTVFHVGANSNTLATSVNDVMRMNYQFTKDLADWASAREVPMIYSSSAACFGNGSGVPENLYAWSKQTAEDYVRLSGGVSLRYFNVYGPGEENKGVMASFPYQAWSAFRRGEMPLLFTGEPKRDFIHIDDVVSANILAKESFFSLQSGIFEVGTGTARTFEDCMRILGILWDYAGPSAIPSGYQFFTQANPGRFLPGWRAELELEPLSGGFDLRNCANFLPIYFLPVTVFVMRYTKPM